MRTCILMLLMALMAFPALAQDGPRITLDEGFKGEKIELKQVAIETRLVGHVAETSMTMAFHNPGSRNLAGDLVFPLPEGAVVSGYALDVNGVLVDGVAVEKEKARVVFEKEMRKGVDPGLVEQVAGNSFKTRVFPIPPRGTRTIRVSYVSEPTDSDGKSVFLLPVHFSDPIGRFALRVLAVNAGEAPQVNAGEKLGKLSFKSGKAGYRAEINLEKVAVNEDLKLELAPAGIGRVMVEKGTRGEHFFVVNDVQKDPRSASEKGSAADLDHLTLLWDASNSRAKDKHDSELAFLKAYFVARPAKTTVDLVLFRNVMAAPKTFVIQGGNADELLTAIGQAEYDGGTQMGVLQATSGAKGVFLFTDGISSFGRESPEKLTVPMYVFTSAARSNVPFLKGLAMKTGGDVFNLQALKPETIVSRIGQETFNFIKAEVVSGSIDEVYPSMPQAVDGRMMVAGKLLGDAAVLRLHYGVGTKTLKTTEVEIKTTEATTDTLIQRLWAQKKLAELLINAQKNDAEIVSLGKRFSLVTPRTSLMVLERFDQYLEHEIEPPACLAEMRKQYWDVVENKKRETETQQRSKLEEVVAMWQERVRWWEGGMQIANIKGQGTFDHVRAPESAPGMSESDSFSRSDERGAPVPQSLSLEETSGGAPMDAGAPMPRSAPAGAPMRDRAMSKSAVMSESASDDFEAKKEGADTSSVMEPGVVMKGWNPETPYIKVLQKVPVESSWKTYLEQKKEHGDSAGFYLDCADFFVKAGKKDLGLQVLSNVAEMDLENAGLLRILGHRLAQMDQLELARLTFETVKRLRPEEPQSWRDLALVLAREGTFGPALELLKEVVMRRWDRFPEIEVVALMEYNSIKARMKGEVPAAAKLDERLLKNLHCDMRIVMTWDTDMADMDIWVIEPNGEKAFYSNRFTQIGGLVSRDFTQGYGPEEYCVRKAMKGMYKIQSNYYGSSAPSLSSQVTVQVEIFSNFGRADEKRKAMTLRLKESRDTYTVGEVEF